MQKKQHRLGGRIVAMLSQAARDGLAALHGEPLREKHIKREPGVVDADSLHTHTQQSALDSLVWHRVMWRDLPHTITLFDVPAGQMRVSSLVTNLQQSCEVCAWAPALFF